MLKIILIALGTANTIGGGLMMIWPNLARRWVGVLIVVVGVGTLGGALWIHVEESYVWVLSETQKNELESRLRTKNHKFPVPIFWAKDDAESFKYAEDLFVTFRNSGWKKSWLEPRAYVGAEVRGLSVNVAKIDGCSKPPEDAVVLRNLLTEAQIDNYCGTEDLLPKGRVGFKVGRPPK